MGVYTRFKKDPDGFRSLVQLLETTPASRRKKMIDVGMSEDPDYTQKAVDIMFTFKDIIGLPDMELTEVIATTSPSLVGIALQASDDTIKARFLGLSPPKMVGTIRESMDVPSGNMQISAAQSKMIESARKLERQGLVKTKRIVP